MDLLRERQGGPQIEPFGGTKERGQSLSTSGGPVSHCAVIIPVEVRLAPKLPKVPSSPVQKIGLLTRLVVFLLKRLPRVLLPVELNLLKGPAFEKKNY